MQRSQAVTLAFAVLAVANAAAAAAALPTPCSPLAPEDVAKLLKACPSWFYLDVRTEEEFEAAHSPMADINIPSKLNTSGELEPNPVFVQQVKSAFWDRSTHIVVGCKSGVRATAACTQLADAGFTALINLEGGFDAWAAAGLRVSVGPVPPLTHYGIEKRMRTECTAADEEAGAAAGAGSAVDSTWEGMQLGWRGGGKGALQTLLRPQLT